MLGSQCSQGLTRDLTLGIWEMLRPVGMTVAPPHSLAHLSVARQK